MDELDPDALVARAVASQADLNRRLQSPDPAVRAAAEESVVKGGAAFIMGEGLSDRTKEIVSAVSKRLQDRYDKPGVIVIVTGKADDLSVLGRNLLVTMVDDDHFGPRLDPLYELPRFPVRGMVPHPYVDAQAPEFPTLTPKQKKQQKAREKTHENVRRRPPRSIK